MYFAMEFKVPGQGHTLACMIRKHLDDECDEDFCACTVIHPKDDFLMITAPSQAHIRRSLLNAKEDLNKLDVFLAKGPKKRTRNRT